MRENVTQNFVHGVYIIGSCYKERLNGMTAAWVSQVSLSPVMVMVAVSPERYTYELIKAAGKFSISQLYRGQLALAKDFGFVSGRESDKFKTVEYELVCGLPVLKDCLCWAICSLEFEYKAGDHFLLGGKLIDGRVNKKEEEPLIFKWEDYF